MRSEMSLTRPRGGAVSRTALAKQGETRSHPVNVSGEVHSDERGARLSRFVDGSLRSIR